ncbi:hypothetical protein MIR68_003558 [Amoeboaphelidium protococcarum]|nr:hypothetical protein MIR68_003558 [Amoeboaphelidium protococcarum]
MTATGYYNCTKCEQCPEAEIDSSPCKDTGYRQQCIEQVPGTDGVSNGSTVELFKSCSISNNFNSDYHPNFTIIYLLMWIVLIMSSVVIQKRQMRR